MARYYVIVESPTKIKTLQKMLGKEYSFGSSIGHIRDLPEKKYGIELKEDQVVVDYEVLPQKKETVKQLIKEAKEADLVYLCPDPDREGEAIAWHIRALLPKEVKTQRITFNSITKSEVERAIKEPREIDQHLVDAQQARRILDRMVGYGVSPLIVQRVQLGRRAGVGALSAGRVQSVALKLVVEREQEIRSFISEEYWSLTAHFEPTFSAQLYSVDGDRIVTPIQKQKGAKGKIIADLDHATAIEERIAAAKSFLVTQIDRSERKRHPVAPFITSTLQQEASRHYGFSAQRTMNIAQELYEGINLGQEGVEGLITYMRTDSVRISQDALKSLRSYIPRIYGQEYLHESVRQFGKKKSTQDAHEAIRPTSIERAPDTIKNYLSSDQWKLYKLIWNRFTATQMASALYDTVQCDLEGKEQLLLRASGSQLKFPGFLKLYREKRDDQDEEDEQLLPEIQEGQILPLARCEKEQSFTKPPPRYSEASLVKALEESGIGRPSTYASIMNKIQSRSYTLKEKGRLKPTELGEVTTKLLESYFTQIMNLGFTAEMEDDLEKVARAELSWDELILNFWKNFEPTLESAKESAHVPKIDTSYSCPSCKEGSLQKIWAGQNFFLGCNRYPECEFRCGIEEYEFDKSPYSERFDWNQPCPKCSSAMKIRRGPYGVFLGCTNYPECKGLVQIPLKGEGEQMARSAPCPAIGCEGNLSARRSRFGKLFFSCSEYPNCDVIGSTLEEIDTKYVDHPKTAAKQKTKKTTKTKKSAAAPKKRAKKPATKPKEPLKLSKELQKVIATEPTTRAELTKAIWDYIKGKKLQDPSDGRYILCDGPLQKVLGGERVHMTAIAKALSAHIL